MSPKVKECENQSTFAEVMGKNRVSCFLTHGIERSTRTIACYPLNRVIEKRQLATAYIATKK